MRTRDLINALTRDQRREPAPEVTFARFMLTAGAASLLALLVGAGLRPDFVAAALVPRVLFKWALASVLVIAAAGSCLRLARPGESLGGWLFGLWTVALALLAAVAVELVRLPPPQWGPQARGMNASWCLRMIPMLAAAPLAAGLIALRRAAPTRPVLAGASAGLLAGAMGAAIYALHCTDDSPLFVASWYTLGIAFVVGIGALLGKRILRW